jgi:transcriptional regulator with XRE-family HTH domain
MKQGVSQVKLAKTLRVNDMTIVNWEKGKSKSVPNRLEELEAGLHGLERTVEIPVTPTCSFASCPALTPQYPIASEAVIFLSVS